MKSNGRDTARFGILMLVLAALLALNGNLFAQRASNGSRKVGKKPLTKVNKGKRQYDAALNKVRQNGKTLVLPMQYHGVSESLRELAKKNLLAVSPENGPVQENEVERLFQEPRPNLLKNLLPDPIQTLAGPAFTATIGSSFDAVTAAGFAPPDTTMAVGPNHIVVWVNARYAVYNKSGTIIVGPLFGNSLFAGVGNLCETTNRGDPILQYDRLADRWILSQFAFNTSGPNIIAPYLQCFAVSTTNDPTGTYYRYTVTFGSTSPEGFNDYGKLGVWPDAYYTAYNIFGGSPAGNLDTGAGLCASDRTKMLAGDPTATTLCAPIAFYAGGDGFLPADLDGITLPTDTTQGGLFIRYDATPSLNLIKLKPNFATSTVTITDGFGGASGSFISVPVPATTLPCNGTGGTCVAQPGTANLLDTLGDRLMYRAAYRNRGGTDSLVVAQSVDPDGAGIRSSAVRWYEIRNPFAASPTLFQVGTFDEGGAGDRWMGSIAMNKDGDMMMGYSIVNSATMLLPNTAPPNLKPSIALTGRRLSDPLNTMQTEQIVLTGSGSQTGTLTRWGDYTTIQTDPSDDQGFCFVGQYLPADGTFNWRSRVICAKFPAPSAATVLVGGRILTSAGSGIARARVTITDRNGSSRSTISNSFGYYRFDDIQAGEIYTISVVSKRYSFAPIVRQIFDSVEDLDIIAR